jgi:hypothetical protein
MIELQQRRTPGQIRLRCAWPGLTAKPQGLSVRAWTEQRPLRSGWATSSLWGPTLDSLLALCQPGKDRNLASRRRLVREISGIEFGV